MDFLSNANGTELVFWLTAIAGTVFFFLRVAMMIVGGFGDDVGGSDGANVDADASAPHHSDDGADTSFKLVSLNSITGFIMMFGWAGLASYLQFHLGEVLSFALAFLVGLICMVITASLFRMALKLSSPGARFNVYDALNTDAEVYLRIPATGVGKVKISANGESRIINAVSEEKKEIESFQRVTVVRIVNSDTVSVKEI